MKTHTPRIKMRSWGTTKHTRRWIPHRHRWRTWMKSWPIILIFWCVPPSWQLFLKSSYRLCLCCTTSLNIILLSLNIPFKDRVKPFYFSFSALCSFTLFSCHFGNWEHLVFIFVLNSGNHSLNFGTLTVIYSGLASRILTDDPPTSLQSIARFFNNLLCFQ